MNFFCKLFGHTWTHRTDNPRIAWNTTKNLSELAATSEREAKFWLECQRCGDKNENPSRDQVKSAI